MWEGLIQKAKDGGLDCIDTYVFWNIHEPSPGNVLQNFSSNSSSLVPFVFLWNCRGIITDFNLFPFFGVNFSTTLKEDMIWFDSLRWFKKPDCMFTSGLGLMFVLSGTLGSRKLKPLCMNLF